MIIESVRHVYFCKNSNFYCGDLKTKWRMFFLGVKEREEIYIKKSKKNKNNNNWDLTRALSHDSRSS